MPRWAALAIVDDEPAAQYLAPEFELLQQLFRRQGLATSIADPQELEWRDGKLWHQGAAVDMVYKRLTDFILPNGAIGPCATPTRPERWC